MNYFLLELPTDPAIVNKLKKEHIDRIEKMEQFTNILCSFEKYPIVGDNDSGHILDVNGGIFDKRELVKFCQELLGHSADTRSSYGLWIDMETIKKEEPSLIISSETKAFPNGGFCYVQREPFKILFHAGSIGRKGMGSHGHNDQLSFVMDINSYSFIIDPGSYVYKRNPLKRHYFRSTRCHNTPQLGDVGTKRDMD